MKNKENHLLNISSTIVVGWYKEMVLVNSAPASQLIEKGDEVNEVLTTIFVSSVAPVKVTF